LLVRAPPKERDPMKWFACLVALLSIVPIAGAQQIAKSNAISRSLRAENKQQTVIGKAMRTIHNARREGRTLSRKELGLVHRAEQLVMSGPPLPPAYKSIARFGHRPHQTLLSLADVGPGHLAVTLKNQALLSGLIIHNEYIDRESKSVAPYRMISPRE